ncbi:MAG: methylated-DNA--[protein]-cysteine S-methyltransferase [Alphaproteobacteria bacterium]
MSDLGWPHAVCGTLESSLEAGESPPGLGALARRFGIGERRLRREFREVFGVTPTEFVSAWRATRFRDLLLSGVSVSEAVYGAGYGSSSRAYESAEKALGLPPGRVRRGSGGERIERASAGSCLGVVTIGVSQRGICAIVLQPDSGWPNGVEKLRQMFPKAELRCGQLRLESLLERVVELVERPPVVSPELPLDIRGTVFQRRVWKYLRSIPVGETRSYGEVAAKIGHPAAVRAVGRACAVNRLPLAVPCHRVITGSGGLGGYAYGLEAKRRLLESEAASRGGDGD